MLEENRVVRRRAIAKLKIDFAKIFREILRLQQQNISKILRLQRKNLSRQKTMTKLRDVDRAKLNREKMKTNRVSVRAKSVILRLFVIYY